MEEIFMTESDLKDLVKKIQTSQAEFQNVEVKRANKSAPKRLFDTLSSFSNQDNGGVIVFGMYEEDGFLVTGVEDVQALQKAVMEQCGQMEPNVRAVFTVAEIDGKQVVSAEIPPVDITERPCFYRAQGRLRGSFIRVGDSDQHMNEYEVYSYEAYRKKYQDEIRVVERADMLSLDKLSLESYLLKLKLDKPNLARLEEDQIMQLMSIIKDGKPTLAAELLFGLYPQAYFPQLGIIAATVPGAEKGDTDIDGSRFIDNQRIEGTIPEMLDGALKFVRRNMRVRTIIDSRTGKRQDRTDYPVNAVREAVLNALVHRDYSIHTEGMPIQITMYSDRMEIQNPGGLYGRLTIDTLGKIQPDTRNPVIATALETLGITENRYSGIPTILREFRELGLPEPEFEDNRGEFIVRFSIGTAHKTEDDKSQKLKEFCAVPRSREEIADFLGLRSVSYAMKRYVQPLIDSGVIRLTIPDTVSSPNQRYYSV